MMTEREIYRALMDWREARADAFRMDLSAELAREFKEGLPATAEELLYRTAMVVNAVSTRYIFQAVAHVLAEILRELPLE